MSGTCQVEKMRSKDNCKIITSASQEHLLKLRYTKAQCCNCKKICPYILHVISQDPSEEFVVDEDIEIVVHKQCCQGTLLVCQFCIDLYDLTLPECPACIPLMTGVSVDYKGLYPL